MVDTQDYIASGYLLSRHVGAHDCTGIELRPVTVASDHSPRKFFPDAWTLSWCSASRAEQVEESAVFGVAERDLDRLIAWADESFETAFGAWNVFFTLEDARAAIGSFLAAETDVELWGVGLHRDLRLAYCESTKPSAPKPGFGAEGSSGVHIATCLRPAPLAAGGTILGHELLVNDVRGWNSLESRHVDEGAVLRAAGVVPNDFGLIDSYDQALACIKHLDSSEQTPITGWLPWLLVRYPL